MGPAGLADFEGSWRIARRIDDRRAGVTGTFDGRADFVPDGQGLTVTETGLMRYGDGPALEGRRVYLWRPDPPHRIAVHFDDGRFFHAIDIGSAPEATHHCAPDLYRVAYDFSRWPLWRAVWTVTGPRKDYTSTTDHAPLSPRR